MGRAAEAKDHLEVVGAGGQPCSFQFTIRSDNRACTLTVSLVVHTAAALKFFGQAWLAWICKGRRLLHTNTQRSLLLAALAACRARSWGAGGRTLAHRRVTQLRCGAAAATLRCGSSLPAVQPPARQQPAPPPQPLPLPLLRQAVRPLGAPSGPALRSRSRRRAVRLLRLQPWLATRAASAAAVSGRNSRAGRLPQRRRRQHQPQQGLAARRATSARAARSSGSRVALLPQLLSLRAAQSILPAAAKTLTRAGRRMVTAGGAVR